MKAIVYKKYGGPDVLKLIESEKPTPKNDELLIKIVATSVNSYDWDKLRGKPFLYRLIFGLSKPKHHILGCDIAGRVESVGINVKNFKPGDEVFGDISESWGGFAEYVCVKENQLSHKPPGISFQQAATIPHCGVLAYQALSTKEIKKGDKVLLNGAGGGVGSIALQLAKLSEAEVTCVDCQEKLAMLSALGADNVIDYKKQDFTRNGVKYDLVIDVVSNRSPFEYNRSLLKNGKLVLIGGTVSSLIQTGILGSILSKISSKKFEILMHKPNEGIEQIITKLTAGKLLTVIDKCYSLKDVPKALDHFGKGTVKGKLVIEIEEGNN